MDIRFEKREHLKEKPDQKHLGFGKYMTDYMFVMDWTKEEGWKDARIVPEGPITDRKSTRLNSSHNNQSRMPSSA